MDSFKWYNQTTEMNGQFNNNNAGDNEVDLTLKLGLSSSDIHQETPRGNTQQGSVVDEGAMNNIVGEQNLNGSQYAWPFDQMGSSSTTTVQSHFHQNSPFYPNPQQGLVSEGAMNIEGQQNFNGSQYAWPSDQMGSSSTVHNMNYGNGFNQFSAPPSVGFPPHKTTDSYNCFAPTWPLPSPPPVVPPNGGTLLDVPPRRAAAIQQQRESGSFSDPSLGAQGQRFGTYNNPYKRCTNRNCNTNDTPMWRKGPQGPKTLCNACGIKYRKETEKKKKEEARRRGQHS